MNKKTRHHPISRRFAANLAAILTSDILNKGTTFLIYVLVARQLGTYAFGQMSLALTLFYSFQVVATFGMQTLITREVAKDAQHSGKYFASSLLVGLITAVGSMLLLAGAVVLLNYPADTRDVILITSLGLLPFAISTICEAVIRGWEKMHLIAFVQVPVNLLKVAATLYVLWTGGSIYQIVAVIVVSRVLIAAALFILTWIHLGAWKASYWDFGFVQKIARRSTTFVAIDTVTAWWTSLNIVLLSKMTSETDVGLYNAAAQLMVPLGIFYQSVMVAAFPIMCRKFSNTKEGLDRVSNRLIELLMVLAIPGTVGLMMVAGPALEFVYKGEGFGEAAGVVRITAFILILKALTFAFGHILLAGSREGTTLRIVSVNLFVNLVIGWLLISSMGLIGAAVAALITRIVDVIQHYKPVKELVAHVEFGRLIWKPLLASVVMVAYLSFFRDQYLPVLIATAALLYFVVWMAFESWTVGGIRNLGTR